MSVDTTFRPETRLMSPEEIVDRLRSDRANPVVNQFHHHWYTSPMTWPMTRYRGIPMLKAPNDLQIYHEILHRVMPRVVIETGTCFGGSALWFADQLSTLHGDDASLVISIDVEPVRQEDGDYQRWGHPSIRHLQGDCLSQNVVSAVDDHIADQHPVLVSLDSDHHKSHVFQEMERYASFVTPGSYLVVEDTNISGRPMMHADPGPGAAVDAFLVDHPEFHPDPMCERYMITMHPGGWLRRD